MNNLQELSKTKPIHTRSNIKNNNIILLTFETSFSVWKVIGALSILFKTKKQCAQFVKRVDKTFCLQKKCKTTIYTTHSK